MGLESTASHSLVSSSSSKLSNSSSSTILVFFEAFVVALGLDIEVGPSKHAAATSFKVVVQELSDLRTAPLWLETDALWDLFPMGCVDLRINHQ